MNDIPPVWLRYEAAQEIWTLQVHTQPGASRDDVVGAHGDRLKIKVAAPATEHKANARLIEFLSGRLRIARSQISILRGENARQKTLAIRGMGPDLKTFLGQLLADSQS